jgi:ABC-2 type transport system ATP-binding protein
MLEVRHLTKRYSGIPAVEDVSFTIAPGEILGYLGPNGSGKSTTVKVLTGLIEPSAGEIWFRGACIQPDSATFRARLGYVPEEPNVYPHLSGREYLQLVGRLHRIPRRELDRKIDALLHSFDIWEARHDLLSSYSKGMRQKVLLSAALLHDPDLLILDEPFSGLDVTAALMFRHLLSELARQGKMILYSSHVLEVVEKICSRVVILHHGRVVAYESVERLRQLRSLPSLEAVFSELVLQEDVTQTAADIVAAMKMHAVNAC